MFVTMLAVLLIEGLQLWRGTLNTHGPRVRIPFPALAVFFSLSLAVEVL